MSVHAALLTAHLLGATVWTGGHLVLCLSVLPTALRLRDAEPVRRFEAAYERIGLPALLVQVASGLGLAQLMFGAPAALLEDSPLSRLVWTKLALLAATVALAAHARLSIIPRLDAARLPALALHIVAVTAMAVGFVVAGLGLRTGLFA